MKGTVLVVDDHSRCGATGRWTLTWVRLMLASLGFCGCASVAELHQQLPVPTALPPATFEPVLPLVLDGVRIYARNADGAPSSAASASTQPFGQEASPLRVQRVMVALRSAQVFSRVYPPEYPDRAPAGSAHITVDLQWTTSPHRANPYKIALGAASMGVLLPFIRVGAEAEHLVRAHLTLPNGVARTYEAMSRGTALNTVFDRGAGPKLWNLAMDANLASIASQIRSDPAISRAATP